MHLGEESCMSSINTFESFTETENRLLLKRSSNAFCKVDPMPACERESGCFDNYNYEHS